MENARGTQLMAVVHVEESQVARFRAKIDGLPDIHVVSVDSPLLIVQCGSAEVFESLEKTLGGGRISPHRVYRITDYCRDPAWIPHSACVSRCRDAVYRVVGYPHHLQAKITQLLADSGVQVHPTRFTHELNVVFSAVLPQFGFGFGVRPRRMNEEDEDESVRNEAPCRAYYKLQEAVEWLGGLPPNCRALDIGASPGGWTEYLSTHGAATVVAVDPGNLTIPVDGKSIVHLNMLVEDAMPLLDAMDKFHVCVCDINVRPHLMASLIASVAPRLHPNALVILTLKLGRRPTEEAVQRAVRAVESTLVDFRDFQVRWLHANTQNERTLAAVRRGGTQPAM